MNTKYYQHPRPFMLESGRKLKDLQIGYHTYGKLNEKKDNVIWVCHSLTGSSNVFGWWSGLFGNDCLFNPIDHFIVCANVPGSTYGSSNPLSINKDTGLAYYLSFPAISVRDIVNAHSLLAKWLGISEINTLIGGAFGGQQALEWAIIDSPKIKRLVLLACNAKHSKWGIAFNEVQRQAIMADRTFFSSQPEGGNKGLAVARSIALLSYRSYETYSATLQETGLDKIADYSSISYQNEPGETLIKRFNAYSYSLLSKAMDDHDVGRGRGTPDDALNMIQAKTLVIGITSDGLFPLSEQRLLVGRIRDAQMVELNSIYGHDGFLMETETLTIEIGKFMACEV